MSEPVSQAVMTVTEVAPFQFAVEIEGSDLSLEVAQIMVKFLNDCLQQIHADQKNPLKGIVWNKEQKNGFRLVWAR